VGLYQASQEKHVVLICCQFNKSNGSFNFSNLLLQLDSTDLNIMYLKQVVLVGLVDLLGDEGVEALALDAQRARLFTLAQLQAVYANEEGVLVVFHWDLQVTVIDDQLQVQAHFLLPKRLSL